MNGQPMRALKPLQKHWISAASTANIKYLTLLTGKIMKPSFPSTKTARKSVLLRQSHRKTSALATPTKHSANLIPNLKYPPAEILHRFGGIFLPHKLRLALTLKFLQATTNQANLHRAFLLRDSYIYGARYAIRFSIIKIF